MTYSLEPLEHKIFSYGGCTVKEEYTLTKTNNPNGLQVPL